MNTKIETFVRENPNNDILFQYADNILELLNAESPPKRLIPIIQKLGLEVIDGNKKSIKEVLDILTDKLKLISWNGETSMHNSKHFLSNDGTTFLKKGFSFTQLKENILKEIESEKEQKAKEREFLERSLTKLRNDMDEKVIAMEERLKKEQSDFFKSSTKKNENAIWTSRLSLFVAALALLLSASVAIFQIYRHFCK